MRRDFQGRSEVQACSRAHVQTIGQCGRQYDRAPYSIDRLGRTLFVPVIRIRVFQAPGNLLGRAALGQVRPHILPQPGDPGVGGPPRLTGPNRCQGCTVQARYALSTALQVYSRLTMLGKHPHIDAIVHRECPWAGLRLTVSRSSARICRSDRFDMATP